MKRGIRFCRGMSQADLRKEGFSWVEAEWDGGASETVERKADGFGTDFLGSLRLEGSLLKDGSVFLRALEEARRFGASLLTVGTRELESPEALEGILAKETQTALASGLSVCVENGYAVRRGRVRFHSLSDGKGLSAMAGRLNARAGRRVFGAGLDMEAASLLGLNPGELAREMGAGLMCVGAADNGGEACQGQLPYTFTRGRGERSTDWPGLIKGLWDIGYEGPVIFRLPGLFGRLPKPLFPVMIRLLGDMAGEWERQLSLEQRLRRAEGNIILFGCGIRFENYMTFWGKDYPPALAVDNNPAWHGKRKRGILAGPPERILEFSPERRLILVCCERFEEIGRQLEAMGADYEVYDDAYWGRFIV